MAGRGGAGDKWNSYQLISDILVFITTIYWPRPRQPPDLRPRTTNYLVAGRHRRTGAGVYPDFIAV